jgi:hypothetical protein
MPGGGSVTSWTERSGGYGGCLPARGCSTAGWRWWPLAWLRPCLFLCRWAAARRGAGSPWGMGWCCRTPCRWRGGGGSSGPCWPSSWPAVGGCRPFPAAVLAGPGHPGGGLFGGHLRQPVALSGRPGGRRPPRGPVPGRFFVPFGWRSGRWAGQAVPQARSSMVRDGRGGNRWRATRAPGQHGARLAE